MFNPICKKNPTTTPKSAHSIQCRHSGYKLLKNIAHDELKTSLVTLLVFLNFLQHLVSHLLRLANERDHLNQGVHLCRRSSHIEILLSEYPAFTLPEIVRAC